VDLTLSPDQLDLRTGLRDYLADRWNADRLRAAIAEPGPAAAGPGAVNNIVNSPGSAVLAATDWRELADLGVFGLTVPEERGGMGLALADAAIVFEELGTALVPGPLVATFLAAGLVPGAIEGDAIVTWLDTGTQGQVVEHPSLSTHVVVADPDGLFLRQAADLAAAPAEIPLDPLTPVGIVPGGVAAAGGERIGTAADAAAWRLRGTVLTAALQVGVARGGLSVATRYAKERVQFGRPIGGFQAVKHLLAESLVRIELARAAVLAAAVIADDPGAGDSAEDDPHEAAATAKLLADDAATVGGRTCVQVHGGMGFTWEVLAHLYLKRAWVHETSFGTTGEHAAFLAERLGLRA
jgi:alkylation response protein AidB-like acyl-CoA dehydrogenase